MNSLPSPSHPIILLRGGGDLASGVALRLYRAGFRHLLITEIAQPLTVRRLVAFAEAVYRGAHTVEEVTAVRVDTPAEIASTWQHAQIPVMIDPTLARLRTWQTPHILIDARMTKQPPDTNLNTAPLTIGLGPGFIAGENCHAVIETNRGHTLGRVYWHGSAASDTGIPEAVQNRQSERVLRSPADGILRAHARLGTLVCQGELLAEVSGIPLYAPFDGALRGLVYDGLPVTRGLKIGDLDPRCDLHLCSLVSDKALAIGGGVLEAILAFSKPSHFITPIERPCP